MSNASDVVFCGHCGERLPKFGSTLGYCASCARRFRKTIPAYRAAPLAGGMPYPKDPLLAGVLSAVFPGAGQIYNGHFIKALLVFFLSPLVIPYVLGVLDAFFSARRISAEFVVANAAVA